MKGSVQGSQKVTDYYWNLKKAQGYNGQDKYDWI